jgi:hypothetical protein
VVRASERVRVTAGTSVWRRERSCEISVAAWADGAKSMLGDAYGIWVPGVVGHFAENLHNTGSALHAR